MDTKTPNVEDQRRVLDGFKTSSSVKGRAHRAHICAQHVWECHINFCMKKVTIFILWCMWIYPTYAKHIHTKCAQMRASNEKKG
jgi:hypothetical protein